MVPFRVRLCHSLASDWASGLGDASAKHAVVRSSTHNLLTSRQQAHFAFVSVEGAGRLGATVLRPHFGLGETFEPSLLSSEMSLCRTATGPDLVKQKVQHRSRAVPVSSCFPFLVRARSHTLQAPMQTLHTGSHLLHTFASLPRPSPRHKASLPSMTRSVKPNLEDLYDEAFDMEPLVNGIVAALAAEAGGLTLKMKAARVYLALVVAFETAGLARVSTVPAFEVVADGTLCQVRSLPLRLPTLDRHPT